MAVASQEVITGAVTMGLERKNISTPEITIRFCCKNKSGFFFLARRLVQMSNSKQMGLEANATPGHARLGHPGISGKPGYVGAAGGMKVNGRALGRIRCPGEELASGAKPEHAAPPDTPSDGNTESL